MYNTVSTYPLSPFSFSSYLCEEAKRKIKLVRCVSRIMDHSLWKDNQNLILILDREFLLRDLLL